MQMSPLQRNLVLGVLFFLPVAFLLFLYPSTHNYEPLEIVGNTIHEVSQDEDTSLKDHITILTFLGKDPMAKSTEALNLKELVYDKFKGFKKFQIVVVAPKGFNEEYDKLKKEIERYEELRFWHYLFHEDTAVETIFNSLKSNNKLDANLATSQVFIVDKDLNQRGRLDDRDEDDKEGEPVPLYSYNCTEVSEIKNKMGDDIRILFTEYRQKRKGKFDSSSRRADDLKVNDNE